MRHFIGVVSEAWELVNKRFIQKPVGREYQARLHPNGKDALAILKSHFGGSNIGEREHQHVLLRVGCGGRSRDAIGEKDAVVAQKKILGELNLVADQFILFASFCLHAILSKYFAPEVIAEVCEKVADAPQSLDVGLPFYIEPPSEERLIKEGPPITWREGRSERVV